MPRIAKTSLLLNSEKLVNGTYNLTEWTDYSWADELAFIIDVQTVIGAPTAGTIAAKVQKRLPHLTGAIQYSQQRLVDLTPAEKAGWLAEGDFPATLADFTLGAPLTVQRTVRNFGVGANLAIVVAALAGGTAPGFQVTASVIAKG